MQTRTFTLPERGACRVTLIQPSQVLAERREGADRRAPVAAAAGRAASHPPVVERRRAVDRRACATPQRNGLPGRWQGGWLLFEAALPDGGDRRVGAQGGSAHAGQARRLAPVPSGWDTCSEAELAAWWGRATVARAPGARAGHDAPPAADGPAPGASPAAPG